MKAMKRLLILLSFCLLSLSGIAQADYSENDVKQFYRTIQGDYTGQLKDSTTISLHFTPIWEREGDRFHWLYMEASNNKTKEVIEQKIIEIKPLSDISFNVVVYGISKPEMFAGKWSNRNFFDGFNTKILKRGRKFLFLKTKDFEYQTGWNNRKNLKCFSPGDKIHFKFVQEDERFYIKRVPRRTDAILGVTFYKDLTD